MRNFIANVLNGDGKNEWRDSWPVVVAAMVGMSSAQVHLYSIGVMIEPLEKEFGWSRAEITSGLLIISMVLFPFSSLVGIAIDRFGPRRIALFGMTGYCASIALLSLAQPAIWTWWLLWLLVACGLLFITPTVWTAAVTRLFCASRGLALAVTLSATGIISFFGPPLTYFLVQNFGWRIAFVLWAGLAALIALPTLYSFFLSGKKQDPAQSWHNRAPKSIDATGFSLLDNIKSADFFKLAVAGPVMSLVFVALLVNFVPIFIFLGMHPVSAAAIAGVAGIAQLIGRLTGGALLDRFNARSMGAIIVIFPAICCLILIGFGGSVLFALVAVVFFGLCAGAELDVLAYLASRFFGVRKFGTLFGIIIGLCALGAGIGPFAASWIYDLSGSYIPVLWIIIPLCLLSSYCFLTLREYPRLNEEIAEKDRDLISAT